MRFLVDLKSVSKIYRNFRIFIACVVYNLLRHIQDIIIQCFAVIHVLAELIDIISGLNTKK